MNASAYFAVISGIIAYIAYCGSVFLSEYYGNFGVQLQFLDVTTDHYLVRGLDILRYDLVLLLMILLLFVLALSAIAPFSFQILGTKIPKIGPFLLALPAIVLFVDARISSTARSAATRDTFAETTALRRLECLRTGEPETDAWISSLLGSGQKVIVLFRSQDQVILFREPPLAIGQPSVDLYYIVISTPYEMRVSSASSTRRVSGDHFECFG